MEEIRSDSINLIATTSDEGRSVLVVGLKEAYREKPQYVRYLKREFEAGKDLDNAGIFKLLALKETKDCGLAIESEWEDSRPLAEWLREADRSVEEKKRVVRQVAEALEYLHGRNVVHGSLNAGNIFITRKGDNAKLLLVRLRYTDILKQPADSLKYLAPEAKDGTVGVDARADIFSIGVLLKDMGLAEDYRNVVEKCCRFGRNERFVTMEEFIDAFEMRRYVPNERAEKGEVASASANKRMAFIVAFIVVLIGVAVALFVSQGKEGSEPAATPSTEQVDGEPTENAGEQTEGAGEPTQEPASTPDADSVAKQQTLVPADGQVQTEDDGNAFLQQLVPQMKNDLQKIYAEAAGDRRTLRRKVSTYYKGLRRVLVRRHLKAAQLEAFDKAFIDCRTQLDAQQ